MLYKLAIEIQVDTDVLRDGKMKTYHSHEPFKDEISPESGYLFWSSLSSGKLYCLDAGYREYRLLDNIIQKKSSFVVRLQGNTNY